MSRRWRNLVLRRQRWFNPPWPAPTQPTAAVPNFQKTRRPRLLAIRKGEFQPTPAAVPKIVVFRGQKARRGAYVRRAESFVSPPPVHVAGPGPLTPKLAVSRRPKPSSEIRHGTYFTIPPQGMVAGTGPLTPKVLRQSRRPQLPVRRGEFTQPPWPQQVTLTPAFIPRQNRRPSTRSLLIRRGRFVLAPTVPVAVPGPLAPKQIRQNTRRLVITRRGEYLPLPLIGAAPTPDVGFLCQDLAGTVIVESYGGVATVESYGATLVVESYSGVATPESYGGTAANCGR